MGLYKDNLVFKPYAFNNSVLTITNLVTGESQAIQALNMISAEMDEEEFTPTKVASGTSIMAFNPSKSGKITFALMEGSPSTDFITTAYKDKAPVSVTFTDSNAENLDASSSYGYFQKAQKIERTNEVPVPEWVIVSDYMACRAGSFALYTTV